MGIRKLIEGLPTDKKHHLIFGIIVNPFIFMFFILVFHSSLFGFLACLCLHACIEIYQWFTKTGQFEVLDWFAGSYSAIWIYAIIMLIELLKTL
jgi:hypothetical protein